MFERFTAEARTVVVDALGHTRRLGDPFIGSEHLLLAVAGSDTPAGDVLRARGVTVAAVEEALTSRDGRDPFAGIDKEALAAIGIDLDQVRSAVEEALGPQALQASAGDDGPGTGRRQMFRRRRGPGPIRPRFTGRAKAVLQAALKESAMARDGYLGIEHLALGLAGTASPAVRRAYAAVGVTGEQLRADLLQRYRRAS
jgi:ATP-dependent Clp protease ATP-binding subunit ClpA